MRRRNFLKSFFFSIGSGVLSLFGLWPRPGQASSHVQRIGTDPSYGTGKTSTLIAQGQPCQPEHTPPCHTAGAKTTCQSSHSGDCAQWHVCRDFSGSCTHWVYCGASNNHACAANHQPGHTIQPGRKTLKQPYKPPKPPVKPPKPPVKPPKPPVKPPKPPVKPPKPPVKPPKPPVKPPKPPVKPPKPPVKPPKQPGTTRGGTTRDKPTR